MRGSSWPGGIIILAIYPGDGAVFDAINLDVGPKCNSVMGQLKCCYALPMVAAVMLTNADHQLNGQ